MEESHRLEVMKPYDPELFKELYSNTIALRNKLVYSIDSRKFGVDAEELRSWFDVKFIYVFNKYLDKPKNILLGHLINALKTYKCRLVSSSYHEKFSLYTQATGIEDYQFEDVVEVEEVDSHSTKYDLALGFLREQLSEDAFFLLQIELNPPAYISNRLEEMGKTNLKKIPLNLILSYLDIEDTEDNIEWLKGLRDEVNQAINKAKLYFTYQRN